LKLAIALVKAAGDGAGLDDGAAVYGAEVEAFGHSFLPEGIFSMGDLASAAWGRQVAVTLCAGPSRYPLFGIML
jgi:hypothetical protein